MTEQIASISDKQHRLMEMTGGFIAVWDGRVHLGDLLDVKPGGIVRCREKPADCISIVHPDLTSAGCIAGWISDEE